MNLIFHFMDFHHARLPQPYVRFVFVFRWAHMYEWLEHGSRSALDMMAQRQENPHRRKTH